MAGPVLHEVFFGECVKNSSLRYNYDNYIKKHCNVYAQGHDLLMYIELLNFQKNRNISLTLSNYRFRDFVCNYLEYAIKSKVLYSDIHVRYFLYAYISHHILDSYYHPYIAQFCPDYLPVTGRKWLHGIIETLCDSFFIKEKLGGNPDSYKLYKDFKIDGNISMNLTDCIEAAVKETYSISGVGKKFQKAFETSHTYMRLYRYDAMGVKKRLSYAADLFLRYGVPDFFYGSKNLHTLESYLNNEHKPWRNIWDDAEIHTDSFDDIYKKSLEVTVELIDEIERMIASGDEKLDYLRSILPDSSAITGAKSGQKLSFVKF